MEADAQRSSSPEKFKTLLARLNAARELATADQKERIAYLNAYAQAYAGRYDVAIAELKLLAETSTNPATQVRAGSLMVNSYAATRQFTEGLRQLDRNLSIVDKVLDKDLRQHAVGVAAVLYNQLGQHRRALEYANRLLAEGGTDRTLCFADQFRLEALYHLGELPPDDAQIEASIARCAAVNEKIITNFMRGFFARKLAAEGRRDRAIELLRSHLPEVRATKYPRLVSEINSLLAEMSLAKGDSASAERYAESAVALSAQNQFSLPQVVAYKTLYEIALQRNDASAALRLYRQYAESDKAYLDEVKARELAYQIVHQETLQKSQKIELLDQRNTVLELQQQVDKQNAQNTRLLVLLLLLITGSAIFWGIRTKRMQMSLRLMAESDALTTISNRHHFSAQSEATLVQSARDGEDVALLMFDLDHFKSINDRFGHDTGDWVLRRVAETCKGFCRRIDYLGRLGGEEFAILLAGCDMRGANRVAEDCRVRIASIDTTPSGHKFVVTASFGATATSLSGYDLAKLLSHADMMLYRAKREGRNRVCMYDGNVPATPFLQPTTRLDDADAVNDGSPRAAER